MMLLSSSKSFRCSTISPWTHQSKNSRKFTTTITKIKADYSDYPKTKKIIAQSAIAILGLGFVDAGYSGDWSRIGVISKETEDVLKIAAFVVVPLCLFLIFSLSKIQLKERD
ncbi:hypothetical protein KSS87_008037 [Heliosperma pusillum]|nr:hypothetical protein KSS87_008037 [Heliosperma pusillum]